MIALIAFLAIMLIILLFASVIVTLSFINLIRDKVPYVPSSKWVHNWLADNAELPEGAVVYDLGCGDGRVLRKIKSAHPSITAIGYERNFWPYFLGRTRSAGTGVEIRRGNMYKADVRDADMIFCYLLPNIMDKLQRKIKPQLKNGVVVYSYDFSFPNWEPTLTIPNPKKATSKIIMYRV